VARKHNSAASLYIAQTRMFANMKGDAKKLFEESASQAERDLRDLMSGTTPLATIKKTRPYARGGAPNSGGKGQRRAKSPLPINAHTGRLRKGIYLQKRQPNTYYLGSNAPYAKYQLSPFGTRKMIRRGAFGGRKMGGAMGEIERRWRARLKGIRMSLAKKRY
jgi:hypothetical protein